MIYTMQIIKPPTGVSELRFSIHHRITLVDSSSVCVFKMRKASRRAQRRNRPRASEDEDILTFRVRCRRSQHMRSAHNCKSIDHNGPI